MKLLKIKKLNDKRADNIIARGEREMRYGFKVYQTKVNDELLWFAESTDLKYCAGQGYTCDEAIRELENNEREWIQMAIEDGEELPQPSVEYQTTYSGKFTVRLSKSLHEHASQRATSEGISLNSFVQEAIAIRTYSAPYSQIKMMSDIMAQLANTLSKTVGTFNGVNNYISNINAAFVSLINTNQNYKNYPEVRFESVNGGSYGVN